MAERFDIVCLCGKSFTVIDTEDHHHRCHHCQRILVIAWHEEKPVAESYGKLAADRKQPTPDSAHAVAG